MKPYGYIYITTNTINGNVYIGQHKGSFDKSYLGSGNLLKRAFLKHGKENFVVDVLECADTKAELNIKEIYYIEKYKKTHVKKIYNISRGGQGGLIWDIPPMLGRTHTDAAKKAMSLKRAGELNPNYGKDFSGEKNAMFGKKHKESTRILIGQRLALNKGENHAHFGKPKLVESVLKSKASNAMRIADVPPRDLIDFSMKIKGITYNEMPISITNIIASYRNGHYQKRSTLEKNMMRVCEFLNNSHYYKILINTYSHNRLFYKGEKCA